MKNVKLSLPPVEELLGVAALRMEQTPQNLRWHGEGSVLAHTKLVCGEMVELDAFRKADEETRQILYLAAAFHDIGKIRTTRMDGGEWTSPGHARVGAEMARQILWQERGLCGTPEKQRIRETVCNLIRCHAVPPRAIEDPDGVLTLRRIAANGELVPGFSIRLLCILSEVDARGRVCAEKEDMPERVRLCRELAKEAGCYDGPYPFPSAYTAYGYLSGRNVSPEFPLYDDTWGEVILMSGLPGTGKDTWIEEHYPDLPMISLDGIRKEQGISPAENQSKVVDAARQRAKEYLRMKQPFIWNATNFSPMVRKKQIDLFTAYHASVRIVYLETAWEEQLHRNQSRPGAVPEQAIFEMMEKIIPPERQEAHQVEWHCI